MAAPTPWLTVCAISLSFWNRLDFQDNPARAALFDPGFDRLLYRCNLQVWHSFDNFTN